MSVSTDPLLHFPTPTTLSDSFLSSGMARVGSGKGILLKHQTGLLVAGSRMGLNVGESQLVVGILESMVLPG